MYILAHIRGGIFSGVCNHEVQTSYEWTRSHIFKDKSSTGKIKDSYQEDGVDMSDFVVVPLSLVRAGYVWRNINLVGLQYKIS